MLKLIVPLLSLFCLAAGANQIRHLQLDNADLFETSPTNYGLSSVPSLVFANIKTVSVNGNSVIVYGVDCVRSDKTIQELPQVQTEMMNNVKLQFSSVETSRPQMFGTRARKAGLAVYPLQQAQYGQQLGQQQATSNGYNRNMNVFSFNSNGYSVTRYEENNFSISRPNLPDNLNRVFLDGDVVTFVYNDGQLLMKPWCGLSETEIELVKKLRLEVEQAERQFEGNMKQMNQNMANMQQNMQQRMQQNMQNMQMRMQQSMQNLHQNLGGMFQQFPNNNNNFINPAFGAPNQLNQAAYQQPSYGNAFGIPSQQYGGAGAFGSPYANGNFAYGAPSNTPFGQGVPFSRR